MVVSGKPGAPSHRERHKAGHSVSEKGFAERWGLYKPSGCCADMQVSRIERTVGDRGCLPADSARRDMP